MHCTVPLYDIVMDGLNNPEAAPAIKWLKVGAMFQVNWENFIKFYNIRGKSSAKEANIKNRFTRSTNGFRREGAMPDPGYDTVFSHRNWKDEPPSKRPRLMNNPSPPISPPIHPPIPQEQFQPQLVQQHLISPLVQPPSLPIQQQFLQPPLIQSSIQSLQQQYLQPPTLLQSPSIPSIQQQFLQPQLQTQPIQQQFLQLIQMLQPQSPYNQVAHLLQMFPHLNNQQLSQIMQMLQPQSQLMQMLQPQSQQEEQGKELRNLIKDEDAVNLLLNLPNMITDSSFPIEEFLNRMCNIDKFLMTKTDFKNLAILMASESSSLKNERITLEQFKNFLLRFGPLSQSLEKIRDFVNAGAALWYHGNINREKSEELLKKSFDKEECTHFLLRSVPIQNSDVLSNTYVFAVSYINHQSLISHIRLYTDKEGNFCQRPRDVTDGNKSHYEVFKDLKSHLTYLEQHHLKLEQSDVCKPVPCSDFVALHKEEYLSEEDSLKGYTLC